MLRAINAVLIVVSLLDPSNSLLMHHKAVKTLPDGVKAPVITMAQPLPAPKIEPATSLAIKTTPPPAPAPAPVATGSHTDWMIAAGISPANFVYVDYIVAKESGWNPNARNPSSGACGLGQQLPCGKWPGAWNDPIAALRAMNTYVAKYGGWAGAYNYWLIHHNY